MHAYICMHICIYYACEYTICVCMNKYINMKFHFSLYILYTYIKIYIYLPFSWYLNSCITSHYWLCLMLLDKHLLSIARFRV